MFRRPAGERTKNRSSGLKQILFEQIYLFSSVIMIQRNIKNSEYESNLIIVGTTYEGPTICQPLGKNTGISCHISSTINS